MRGQPCALALGAFCLAFALSSSAAAFCRTRTCEFRSDVNCPIDDLTGCSESGAFVYWQTGCVPYAVQQDGSIDEGISALELADLVDQGFRIWSDLSCERGGSPALATSRQGLIACDAVEFNCSAGAANSNLIVFRDDFVNEDFGLKFGVIALTTVTANLASGEIFDADIEINSRDEDFELTASGSNSGARDLSGVINHELGHLLGLSHSRERGALMRALYEGTAAPATDDAAGMCAAFPTGAADPACMAAVLDSGSECLGSNTSCASIESEEEDSGGCACRAAGGREPGSGAWGWGLGLALWVFRRQSQARKTVL